MLTEKKKEGKMNQSLDFLKLETKLDESQKLIISTLRELLQKELGSTIAHHYEKEEFPEAIIPKLAELGMLGSNLSGYGLPGMDSITYGYVMKELERLDSGLRSFVSVQSALVMYPIWAFGNEEQKQKYLPQLASGSMIGCFGLTESEGGSDPSGMATKVTKKSDHWVLHGSKMWITNGNLSQIAIVWAKDESGLVRGFIVPTDSPGLQVNRMQQKLSLRASVTSELSFNQVKVPFAQELPNTKGIKSALMCLSQARYGIAWGVLGAAEACYQEAFLFAKERKLFGESLLHKQLVQQRLVMMLDKISCGQLLALRLAELKESEALDFAHISMGKAHNCRVAIEVARDARDLLGANGIVNEYATMRHMCNLETVITYEGTESVHQLILGSHITGIQAF